MNRIDEILYITSIPDGSLLHLNQQKTIKTDIKPLAFLNRCCLANGSSYEGRVEAFRELTGTSQKPAVLISERQQRIFFPTLRAEHEECVWIQYNAVFHIHSIDAGHTEIIFHTGERCTIPFNYRIINKQLKRCTEFLQKLNDENSIGFAGEYDDLYRTGLPGMQEGKEHPEE